MMLTELRERIDDLNKNLKIKILSIKKDIELIQKEKYNI